MAQRSANGGRSADNSSNDDHARSSRTDSERVEVGSVQQRSLTDSTDADRVEPGPSPTSESVVLTGAGDQFQTPFASPTHPISPQTLRGVAAGGAAIPRRGHPIVTGSGQREASSPHGGISKRRGSTIDTAEQPPMHRSARQILEEDHYTRSPTGSYGSDNEQEIRPTGGGQGVDKSDTKSDADNADDDEGDDDDNDQQGSVTPHG